MSKIKNGGLDQYGAGPFEQQQFGPAGVQWVDGVDLLNCTERRLWLTFVSDGSGQGKGFRLLFSAVPSSSTGRRTNKRKNRRSSRRRRRDRKNVDAANVTESQTTRKTTRRRSKPASRKRRRKQQATL